MTTAGFLVMLLSVGSVTVLQVWCLWRLLRRDPGAKDKNV